MPKGTKTQAPAKSETTTKQSENAPVVEIPPVAVETEEERELREEAEAKAKLEELAKNRARRKAEAEIVPLRTAKAETYKAEATRKRAEAERLRKEAEDAEAEAEAILRGERDETITKAEAEKNGVVRVVVGGNQPKPQAEKKEGARERQSVKRYCHKVSDLVMVAVKQSRYLPFNLRHRQMVKKVGKVNASLVFLCDKRKALSLVTKKQGN